MKKQDKYVYHGSKIQDLKKLAPKESGYGKKFVYATTEIALAVIFMGKHRNSFLAFYGLGKEDKPVFCERARGILNKWYKGQQGSIYVLPKNKFHYEKGMSPHERVFEKSVKVIKEIKIKDLKQYLLKLGKEKKIEITYYKDRDKKYPKDDDRIIRMAINGVKKYGFESTLINIRKYQPRLETKFKREVKLKK